MAEVVPQVSSWWDSVKHGIVNQIATALSAPETVGPNIWSAVKDFGRNLGADAPTWDQSSSEDIAKQFLMGLSVHNFPGPKKLPVYGVKEHIIGAGGNPADFSGAELAQIQKFLFDQAQKAKVIDLPARAAQKEASLEQWQAGSGELPPGFFMKPKFNPGDSIVFEGQLGKVTEGGHTPWIKLQNGKELPVPEFQLKPPTLGPVE